MSGTTVDVFTQKKIRDTFTKTDSMLAIELAKEFGDRVGWAVKQGLPRDIAIEACRVHFKDVGQAMAKYADDFAEVAKDIKR